MLAALAPFGRSPSSICQYMYVCRLVNLSCKIQTNDPTNYRAPSSSFLSGCNVSLCCNEFHSIPL